MPNTRQRSGYLIVADVKNRLKAPCTSVTFYAHLLFGVIVCGGAGVFLTLFKTGVQMADISAALLGYFPALVGAAVLEFTAENQPYIRSLGLIALGVVLPVAFLSARAVQGWQLFWSLSGTALGVFFWWIAYGLNDRFNDVKPQSALGGDEGTSLPESKDKEWKI
jgi:hypothetical protein